MQLFYHQPEGHGVESYFLLSESAEAAAKSVNEHRGEWKATRWGNPDLRREPFTAADFKTAVPNEVLVNSND